MDNFYIKYVGELIIFLIGDVVVDFLLLVCYEFKVMEISDIVFEGFGWVMVVVDMCVVVWVLKGVVVLMCLVMINKC